MVLEVPVVTPLMNIDSYPWGEIIHHAAPDVSPVHAASLEEKAC